MKEIEEIMDEEENNTESNKNNLVEAGSSTFMSITSLYMSQIRTRIREQIASYLSEKKPFYYYLEIRSFINESYTKVGMFSIGDGNTESNPEASMFLYTIPYVFTSDALRQFLALTISVTDIYEYTACDLEGVPIISSEPTKNSINTKKASVQLSSTFNK